MNALVFFGGKNVGADGQGVVVAVDKLEGQHSAFSTQHSAFSTQHLAFSTQRGESRRLHMIRACPESLPQRAQGNTGAKTHWRSPCVRIEEEVAGIPVGPLW